MTLRLKNTYTNALETFAPLDPASRVVTMYTCGPTVYSYAHIGNFRSFLFADIVRRVLERRGYDVRQVMNITDVGHMTEDHIADAAGEDKLSQAARRLGKDPYQVAEHFTQAFVADARAMRLRVYQGRDADDPARHPRATRHVPEILAMITSLLKRGYAYVVPSGEVYFEVSRFAEYGRLSGKVLDDLEAGARVAVRAEKRDPRDFALWKVDEKHLMQWDPHGPGGWPEGDYARLQSLVPDGVDARIQRGFPGWHIECSAMAWRHLGERIDVHTGGEDNIFPHHECEIAQSFGALESTVPAPPDATEETGSRKTFARFWVHGRHLLVDGRKMSKRDGNFFTARDLFDPVASGRPELVEPLEAVGFAGGRVTPEALRYALVSNPYTQQMNFTFALLQQARATIERLQALYERLRDAAAGAEASQATEAFRASLAEHEREFDVALDDNLNTPRALAAVWAFATGINTAFPGGSDAAFALAQLERFDAIFDVLDRRLRSGLIPTAEIARLAEALGTEAPGVTVPDALDADAVARVVAARQAAKRAKDFARADALRKTLASRGVAIEDTPAGVRWRLG